jgi:hypothetical protein
MLLNCHWLEADILNFTKIKKEDFTLKNCAEMMKVILRMGFELVMPTVKRLSPGLYVCFRDFSRFYPDKESEMR